MAVTSMHEWTGVVAEFDEHRGWGTVESADGHRFGFHCAAIADGTRSIAVGRAVRFRTLAKLGRREATSVEPV